MDTQNQFAVFGICLFVGFFGGVLYEAFSFVRLLFGCGRGKNKIVGGGADMLFWICFAFVCVSAAYIFAFPAFRPYMWIGYLLGGIIYLKTLHKIIAFLENLCYNKITKLIKKAKKKEKTLQKRWKKAYDTRQDEENDNGNRRRGDFAPRDFAVRSDLSMDNDCGKKQPHRKGKRRNRVLSATDRTE